MNIPRITTDMLRTRPDQVVTIINRLIDKANQD